MLPNAAVSATTEPLRQVSLPRDSGTHADVFAAIGLADLLADAACDRRVRIVNRGTHFDIQLSRPRPIEELREVSQTAGYRFLQARSDVKPPDHVDALDYPDYRERINALRQEAAVLYAAAQRDRTRVPLDALEAIRTRWPMPPRDWRRYQVLLTLGGHDTANKVHAAIAQQAPAQFQDLVVGSIRALAAGHRSEATWPVSTVQLFAPLAAKGYARLKPDSAGRNDKTKEAWADPFIEWLRYRGYFLAAVPVFYPKTEHIRLLCAIPGDLSLSAYRTVVSALPNPPVGAGPPKIDILATLSLARLLIERSEDYRRPGAVVIEGLQIGNRTPADVIAGLAVTNFQSLGSARAITALAELVLPGWFPIGSTADADAWVAILEEHERIVRGLVDKHSDEFALLQQYRRFLERRGGRALDALLEFAGAYGAFVLRAREANRRVRQFQTDYFRRVVVSMNSDYAAILENNGFRAVAAAVRRATVSAQTLKARGKEHREIRYGLLPDLRRARELPANAPFMTALAEFVSLYNAENARRREVRGQAPANVATEELLEFTRLVDVHGASIVGALLCAYGTCTERREAPADDDSSADAADVGDATLDAETLSDDAD